MPMFPMLQEREKLWLKIGAAIIGIGGISISLYQICKWFIGKKRPAAIQRQIEEQQEEEETTTFGKAERRKAQGIDAYKQKRYNEAIQIFNDAAKMLDGGDEQIDEEAKSRELRASCQNNIAACHDALKNLEACIEYCTAAIVLNPDYVKALTRRAKCYQKLGRIAEAMDDYMDLLTLENENAIQSAHLNQIHHEMDKMIDALIEPQMAEIIQSRVGQAQKISQSIVAPWYFFKLAQNDPLLARAQAIDTKTAQIEMAKGLDRALIALAQQKYDDVARLAIDFIGIELEDCENFAWDNPLERAQAVLLAARFLHYQSLDDAAHSMAERFTPFWDRLDEAQKLANKDLHVAQIVLQMQMLGFGENGGNAIDSSSPSHRLTPTNKQQILQLAEEALRINPKNVDPLLLLGFILICAEQPDEAVNTFQRAKKLDKEHPYVKYYEKCANLLNALQQQDLSRLRHCFYELERALKEANSQHPPPGYVLLKMIEASGQLGLHEVAIEFVRMAVQQMPNNPDVIVYASMMNPDQQMEKEFEKATKVDPNYWRTHRLLAMLRLKKSEYDEAEREYELALEVARSKVELNLLLKEREMMRMTKSRSQRGKRIPQHRQLAE